MQTINYIHDREVHNSKSAAVVVPIINDLFKPQSVIDIGCGLGDWLNCYEKLGVTDILGIDGSYVDRKLLYIREKNFIAHDLSKPLKLKKRYDLAQCLEVAEHLPETAAENLVKILCNASDIIVFSAAIPGQGGQNHINEQPYAYWQEIFAKYRYDFYEIFSANQVIQKHPEVEYWYKHNMVLVAKNTPYFKKVSKRFPDLEPCRYPDTMRYVLIQKKHNDDLRFKSFCICMVKMIGLEKPVKKAYKWLVR